MSDGYYPEYYLRKRKRDRVYGLLTRLLGILVVAGGLGCLAGFFFWQYLGQPKRVGSAVTPQMADQRQELATQLKLADSDREHASTDSVNGAVELQPTNLATLSYGESFPMTSVALVSEQPAQSATAGPPEEPTIAPEAAATQQVVVPESTSSPVAPAERLDADKDRYQEKDSLAGSAEERKSQEKAKAEAKRKEEQKRLDNEKQEAQRRKDELAKQAAAKAADAAPKSQPAAKTLFKVYAGSSTSKDAAESIKSELSSLGLSGSVIKSGPDYLVLVTTVEDYSKAEALSAELRGKGFGAFTTRIKPR